MWPRDATDTSRLQYPSPSRDLDKPCKSRCLKATIKTGANNCLINHCTMPPPAPATLSPPLPSVARHASITPAIAIAAIHRLCSPPHASSPPAAPARACLPAVLPFAFSPITRQHSDHIIIIQHITASPPCVSRVSPGSRSSPQQSSARFRRSRTSSVCHDCGGSGFQADVHDARSPPSTLYASRYGIDRYLLPRSVPYPHHRPYSIRRIVCIIFRLLRLICHDIYLASGHMPFRRWP